MTEQPPSTADTRSQAPDRYDELESMLDDLRTRSDDVPQWEFCEGFMAALLCCRREVAAEEYLPLLLTTDDDAPSGAGLQSIPFADDAQRDRFVQLWTERRSEVTTALAADVETLDDPRAYSPQLFDMRGLVARLPDEERAAIDPAELPAFARLWALGFIESVGIWAEDWLPPRDRETRKLIESAIEAIELLTGDDSAPPDISPYDDADPPSVSTKRFDQFGDALWAVYDLHDIWRSVGPRVDPVRKAAAPGRNDPCPCGSGKKFKKCHGA